MPTEAIFMGGLIFGAIGLGALLFGKTTGSVIKMALGAAILACAYLTNDAWLLWTSGTVLTLILVRWKE